MDLRANAQTNGRAGAYAAEVRLAKHLHLQYTPLLGDYRTYKRSTLSVKEGNESILVKVTARDLAALRASFNAVMRDISTIESAGKLATYRPPRKKSKIKEK